MGQHWYTADRQPMHEVEGKNGNMRSTTIRDARKLNLFPSVTTIIGMLDKPGLNQWIQTQIARATIDNPIQKGEKFDDWVSRIKKLGKEQGDRTAKIGTEIHDAIEQRWNNSVAFNKYFHIAEAVVNKIILYCETDEFEPEQIVIGDGYGGKVDLHNDDFVIDYKTKDIDDTKWAKLQSKSPLKMAYDEECMQLSAYRAALPPGATRMLNVFVDRTIPGRIYIYEHTENMYGQFQCLVDYWQRAKKYTPEQE